MTRFLLGQIIVGAVLIAGTAPTVATAQSAPLRNLTTDRPDTTESPFTVNAGHIQIETTLFGYGLAPRDAGGARLESVEIATTNMRIGIGDSTEIDIVLHPFGGIAAGSAAPRNMGIGGLDLRGKLNLWGNDGGSTALAVLPYVSIPLDAENGIGPVDLDYGVLVPLSIDLGGPFGLGLNTGLTYRRDDSGTPYRLRVPATASLAIDMTDRIGGYYEVAAEYSVAPPPRSASIQALPSLPATRCSLMPGSVLA